MANLASTYRDQGQWTKAEKLFVQVMETSKTVLGPKHPDTLNTWPAWHLPTGIDGGGKAVCASDGDSSTRA